MGRNAPPEKTLPPSEAAKNATKRALKAFGIGPDL